MTYDPEHHTPAHDQSDTYEPEVEVHSLHDQPMGPEPVVPPPQISRGRPYVTYALIAINIIVFIIEVITGATDSIVQLIRMGAKDNVLIASGEYWRLLTPIFLHGGIDHIAFNSLALFSWGRHAETLYGPKKYLAAYMLAGLIGSIASYVFSESISVGASGAIFGIFGMFLYFRREHPEVFRRVFGVQVLAIIAINLVFGFTRAGQIDNFAHLGGLVGGYLAANALGLFKRPPKPMRRLIGVVALAVLFAAGLVAGQMIYGGQDGALHNMELSISQKAWPQVISQGERALSNPGAREEETNETIRYYLYASYFTLAQEEAGLAQTAEGYDHDRLNQAEEYALKALGYQDTDPQDWLFLAAVRLQDDDAQSAMEALDRADQAANGTEPRGYYLRALCFYQQDDLARALEYLHLAQEYDPNDTDVQNAIRQLQSQFNP